MQKVAPQLVDVMYQKEGQVGAVPLTSVTYGDNGRPLSLGSRANGDVFKVPVQDVLAHPDYFLTPSGKRFVINGATVEDPDKASTPVSLEPDSLIGHADDGTPILLQDAMDELSGAFGTKKAAEALIGESVYSVAALEGVDDEWLEGVVGKRAVGTYRKSLEKAAEEAKEAVEDADPS